jgi:hypothetical protein
MNGKKITAFNKRRWSWVPLVILLIIITAACGGNTQKNLNGTNSPAANSSQTVPAESASPSSASGAKAQLQLTSGNYTSGIDFPAGKYNISAVSGSGNVSSSNLYSGGINAAMGTAEADKAAGGNIYQQQYSNINLPDGIVLSISGGVTIEITSDAASSAPLKHRVQPNTKTIDLGNGNFIAGKDFPAGTYDVIAVSGSGNVSSDNMFSGGINAVMGTKDANSGLGTNLYEQAYKNVDLPDGTTITIDAVKIQLVPSK